MPTNADIARAGVFALHSPAFESKPGYCQRLQRQVVQSVTPDFDGLWRPTAALTMQEFRDPRVSERIIFDSVGVGTLIRQSDCVSGALVWKGARTSGASGHAGGIFLQELHGVPTFCVWENSSYHMDEAHMGDVSGAKGWRTLDAFGPCELMVVLF